MPRSFRNLCKETLLSTFWPLNRDYGALKDVFKGVELLTRKLFYSMFVFHFEFTQYLFFL